MKKIFYFIATLGMAITAQAQDTLYFYKDGVMTDKKALVNVDSITFFETKDTLTIDSGSASVNQQSFATMPSATSSSTITYNGYTYSTKTIGNQTWFAENLRTTKYNNSTSIPLVTSATTWKKNYNDGTKKPMMCWYNNNSSSGYGALYNWYVVNKGNLCPTGWRVPTDADWTTLTDYLGGVSVAGGKMKTTGTDKWASPNTDATNSSGFFGNPGGKRNWDGVFNGVGTVGHWFSSSQDQTLSAWVRTLSNNSAGVARYSDFKYVATTVRCIKN
jgi:uncharacterized protein (TIGR02145 family)